MKRFIWRWLVIIGTSFERTRFSKVKIGRRTLFAHLYRIVTAVLHPPGQIKTFWNDTVYLPERSNYELLILGENLRTRGSTTTFRQQIRPGMVVVDLGANIGVYTLLAASLVGEKGRVYAFEPDPENYALLAKNVQANGYRNVVCRQQAVSNKSGEALLFTGEYRVSHSLSTFFAVNPELSITVATTSLDDFFQKQGWPPIDFIKMNIEGWEWFVIEGMTEILSRSRCLKMMLEFYPDYIQKMGIDPAFFIQRLKDEGFTVQIIDEVQGLQPFNDINLRHRHGGNILCERR
jgi:FkbM family methyltransferase